jgi:hypothetical protein
MLERIVVFNQVARVAGSRIVVAGGKEFRIFPGAAIKKDFQEVALADVHPGDHIAGILLPDSDSIIALWAYSDVIYGSVSHYSAGDDNLYLNTPDGGSRIIKLGPETKIYRWDSAVDKKALSGGVWVRIALAEGEDYPRQVDIAETLPGERQTLASYDARSNRIITTGGGEYPVGKLAVITRAGYPILPDDLEPGDVVDISSILGPQPASRVITGLTARENGSARPVLTVSSVLQENNYWISGHTTGTKLYLWEGNHLAKKVSLTTDGRFALDYHPGSSGVPVTMVAVGSGSVVGVNLELRGMASVPELRDITTHWAGPDLQAMAREGLIAGFPDGTFRPGQQVTRAEFTVFLARAFGWYGAADDELTFKDENAIPPWARQSIVGASARGIVAGYPDGSFKPGVPITREEQCAILDRVMQEFKLDTGEQAGPAPFTDRASISPWALTGVDSAYRLGIMVGQDGNMFRPNSQSTRAETAVAVYRLLNMVRQQQQQ